MKDEDQYQAIPKEFYSFETGRPFERCIECDSYLLDGREYVIEKAIRQYKGFTATDTVFDYAVCLSCAMEMRKEFSKTSLSRIDAYFQQSMGKLQRNMVSENDLVMEDCLKECIIKEDPVESLEEYQIYAYCRGDKLFKGVPPYLVGGNAIDEILPLLSGPTTNFLNGFYDKHFRPDPSLMEPDPTPRLVFI